MLTRLKKLMFARLNVLLGALLTLLGFSNCEKQFNEVCLYGQPYARYDIKGTILDEEGNKLAGMDVTVKFVYEFDGEEYSTDQGREHTTTDLQGNYECQGSYTNEDIRIVVEDPGGVYAADSVMVKLERIEEGKDDWCIGTDVGRADFRLKKLENKE